MLKIEEMKAELAEKTAEVENLLKAGKKDEAKALLAKCKKLKSDIEDEEIKASVDDLKKDDVKDAARREYSPSRVKDAASYLRAAIKKMSGRQLTEAENALLMPTTTAPEGENGESFLIPVEVQTRIRERIRQFKSIRNVIGVQPVGTLSGSFPIENIDALQGLIDFTDGEDGEDTDDIKFGNVRFDCKEYAAFISLSNTLLSLSDESLLNRIADIFAKKAIITENQKGFVALAKDKTVKDISTYEDLRDSIIEDLDPAVEEFTIITTNQSGFKWLCKQKYANGLPIMVPDASNPRIKLFDGYVVEVFSNKMLPNTAEGKAPIFYGDTIDGAFLFEYEKMNFATSSHAGFTKNTTIGRIIEYFDVKQVDGSDACYRYGLIDHNTASATDAGDEVSG